MTALRYNLIVLITCLLVVIGIGVYLTFVRKPAELERVEKAEKVAQMKGAEMKTLLAEYSSSQETAEAAVQKWNSRYKVIPDTLTSAAVVGHLNDLTQEGFETFDVSLNSVERNEEYGTYTLRASGRGYYTSLYRLIWELENNRAFYNVRDLALDHLDLVTQDKETGRERLQVMVSFSMNIDAYFGGPHGASASDSWHTASSDGSAVSDPLPTVPPEVLADRRPQVNPFFPVVMEEVPPNTHDLVEVDNAELVSIVADQAIFKDESGYRKVAEGEDVYLGQLTEVDPAEGLVKARLNRGGIIDEVEIFLETGERFRQAVGPVELQSIK